MALGGAGEHRGRERRVAEVEGLLAEILLQQPPIGEMARAHGGDERDGVKARERVSRRPRGDLAEGGQPLLRRRQAAGRGELRAHPQQVDPIGRHVEGVASTGSDQVRAEPGCPQPRQMGPESGEHVRGGLRPDIRDQLLGGDDVSGAQRQARDERFGDVAAQGDDLVVDAHLDQAQQAHVHRHAHSPLGDARRPRAGDRGGGCQ